MLNTIVALTALAGMLAVQLAGRALERILLVTELFVTLLFRTTHSRSAFPAIFADTSFKTLDRVSSIPIVELKAHHVPPDLVDEELR